jgi:beta-lactamase superfamily II metal-dependent hydrolase
VAIHLPIQTSIRGVEIHFFAVGNGSGSGDAIVIRFGDLHGPVEHQRLVIVDGGYTDDGDAIVTHLRDVLGTDHVDLVISTHPDADHIRGLRRVLEEMDVDALWMHLPWDHTDDIASMFTDGRVTDNSISEKLREELTGARVLAETALARGVPVTEPFTGVSAFDGVVEIVGPDLDFYEKLLLDFRATPDPVPPTRMSKMASAARKLIESFGIETLTDRGSTSAENNTSAITMITVGGHRSLLTGDAGIPALERAATVLESVGAAQNLNFIQVPHHGGRHNVGPSVLDRIVGPRLDADVKRATAYVSAAPDGAPRHPSSQVTNAFRRRGAHVYATQGTPHRHSLNAPDIPGWSTPNPLPFYVEIDEDDE